MTEYRIQTNDGDISRHYVADDMIPDSQIIEEIFHVVKEVSPDVEIIYICRMLNNACDEELIWGEPQPRIVLRESVRTKLIMVSNLLENLAHSCHEKDLKQHSEELDALSEKMLQTFLHSKPN